MSQLSNTTNTIVDKVDLKTIEKTIQFDSNTSTIYVKMGGEI